MKIDGTNASNIVKNLGEQAIGEVAKRADPLNLFSGDTMSGKRATPNQPAATGRATGGRESMEDLLARMGAKDKDKGQAFDIASEAASNVIKGGFKGAGEALGGISGAADALGGIGKAIGSIMGIVKDLMPIIGAVMSFF